MRDKLTKLLQQMDSNNLFGCSLARIILAWPIKSWIPTQAKLDNKNTNKHPLKPSYDLQKIASYRLLVDKSINKKCQERIDFNANRRQTNQTVALSL